MSIFGKFVYNRGAIASEVAVLAIAAKRIGTSPARGGVAAVLSWVLS
jgi:hypothetical protein